MQHGIGAGSVSARHEGAAEGTRRCAAGPSGSTSRSAEARARARGAKGSAGRRGAHLLVSHLAALTTVCDAEGVSGGGSGVAASVSARRDLDGGQARA